MYYKAHFDCFHCYWHCFIIILFISSSAASGNSTGGSHLSLTSVPKAKYPDRVHVPQKHTGAGGYISIRDPVINNCTEHAVQEFYLLSDTSNASYLAGFLYNMPPKIYCVWLIIALIVYLLTDLVINMTVRCSNEVHMFIWEFILSSYLHKAQDKVMICMVTFFVFLVWTWIITTYYKETVHLTSLHIYPYTYDPLGS